MNKSRTSPESTCPVCEQDNQCSAADGGSADTCWCFSATADETVLASLAPQDAGTRCLCANCLNPKNNLAEGRSAQ